MEQPLRVPDGRGLHPCDAGPQRDVQRQRDGGARHRRLRARRYGWEAPIVVRVDDCGEIYARLAEPGDVPNAKLRTIEGPDVAELHELALDDRWAAPERDISSVIAALAVEQANQIGMRDGLGIG